MHSDFFSRNPATCINLASNVDSWLVLEQSRYPDLAAIIKDIERGEEVSRYSFYDNVLQKHNPEEEPGQMEWKKVSLITY